MTKSFLKKGLLTLAMGLGTFGAVQATESISINPGKLIPGQPGVLTFNLDNDKEILGYQMEIALPDGLEFQKNTNGRFLISTTERAEDFVISATIQTNGALKIVGVDYSYGSAITGNSGAIFTVQITVAEDFEKGTIAVSNIVLSDDTEVSIKPDDYSLDVEATVYVSSISITPDTPDDLTVGEKATFTATVSPTNASASIVNWSISPSNVASITVNDNEVTVEGLAVGQATLTATADDDNAVSAQVTINIVAAPIPAESVEISGYDSTAEFVVGNTLQLTATVLPDDATDKEVTWSSANTNVVTVSSTGLLTAVAPGTSVITAALTNNPDVKATVEVTVVAAPSVIPATSVEISGYDSTTEFVVGNTLQLTATVLPADATDKEVTWSSANTEVVTVSATGLLTAVAPGSSVITAALTNNPDVKATVEVTVVAPVVEATSVEISGYDSTTEFKVGQTLQLIATVLPADATDKEVAWSSSNSAVVKVNETGLLTAVAPGTAEITAAISNNSQIKDTVTVTVTDGTTGISSIATDENGNYNIYGLDGKLIKKTPSTEQIKNLKKGIYVINGKKVVIN